MAMGRMVRGRWKVVAVGGLAVVAATVTVATSTRAPAQATGTAVAAAAAPASFPPKGNGVWAYDDGQAGLWSDVISAYNAQASSGHKLNRLYSYGGDLECGDPSPCTAENFASYYGSDPDHPNRLFAGSVSTAAYANALNLAPNIASGATTDRVELSPIIDGRTDDGGYLQGFNGISAATAQGYADKVAGQVCADPRVAGIQFDVEPFNVDASNGGQYAFYLQIAKNFAGRHSGDPSTDPFGCVSAAHPRGRYFSVFTFAKALQPGTAAAANLRTIMTIYANGYVIDSLYDMGSAAAGSLNDPSTYRTLVQREAKDMKAWAGTLSVPYAYAIPGAASAHEYTNCTGNCKPGADGSTGAPMLGYAQAAVAAIQAAGAVTDPLFIGTDVWGFSNQERTGGATLQPATPTADVLHWLAANLPGSGTDATPPPADHDPPSVPTGLVATATTSSSVTLSWNAATDDTAVTSYRVYVDGRLATTAAGTSATVGGLDSDHDYAITVSALDLAGNESSRSSTLQVHTAPADDHDGGDNGDGGDLLTNGGFENGLSGWSCTGDAAAAAGQGSAGSGAVRLTPTATTTANCSQTVRVTPGRTYALSADLRSSSGAYIYVGAPGGKEVASTSSSYEHKTVSFQASSNSATVYVQAYKQQTGATYADQVRLVPAP